MLAFGSYPTPVQRLAKLSTTTTSVWVKRDDLTHPLYGGSKLRKLGPMLDEAKQRGATKIVTMGALGSHHVLATGVFGRLAGFTVEAVVLPRIACPQVREITRASVAQGVKLVAASNYREAAAHLRTSAAAGAYVIPAGGSSERGSLGLVAAAAELAEQVGASVLPEPDLLVVALGSGGTTAGLVAGLEQAGLATRVLAVAIAEPYAVFARKARSLTEALLGPQGAASALRRLQISESYLGDGYGHSTPAGEQAMRRAGQAGLTLDPTYTAKAFAAVLDRVALGRERNVLFWHTLSSAPLEPLSRGAPEFSELPADLQRLSI